MTKYEYLKTPKGDIPHAVPVGTGRSLCGKTAFRLPAVGSMTCKRCADLLAAEQAKRTT